MSDRDQEQYYRRQVERLVLKSGGDYQRIDDDRVNRGYYSNVSVQDAARHELEQQRNSSRAAVIGPLPADH